MRKILSLLPERIERAIENLSESERMKITEIRLRAGRPVAVSEDNSVKFLEPYGTSYIPSVKTISITTEELDCCFLNLCENSVYAHEDELSKGYISLSGGFRAGVCGRYIRRTDGGFGLREISSINIRIAKDIKGFANPLLSLKLEGGVLICGAPHTGKTTLLRDYIRLLSNLGEKIALVDCRGELAASRKGEPILDVGVNTDVISGGKKQICIENALRSMAPQTIAFDEIGNKEEVNEVSDCLNAGVRIITTLHAACPSQLIKRNEELNLLSFGAFEHLIFLDKNFKFKVYKADDLIDKIACGHSVEPIFCSNRDCNVD